MGVSFQVYRVRIGTCNPSVRVKTAKEQAGHDSNQIKWNYKTTFWALLLFCSLAVFLHLCQEDFIVHLSPTQYQSTTACDPSSGPLCVPGMPWTNPPDPPNPLQYSRSSQSGSPFSLLQWTNPLSQTWTIPPWPPVPQYVILPSTTKCCRQPQARPSASPWTTSPWTTPPWPA